MNANGKKTLILGASANPSRYSYLALERLRRAGYPVVGIGKKKVNVGDVSIDTEKADFEDIDTVTVYLNPQHQKEYYSYLLQLKPQRVIFNPGAENPELADILRKSGILPVEACTLVLLSTGQY